MALVEPIVSNRDVVLRIAAAVVLGGMVGFERELSHQPAGLRTHITVALGAALFGILSVHGFDAYVQPRGDTNYQVDVTRVASQVVVGVGFLGAGAILKEGATVRGLTTAASLWATAAIGLAVGLGSFVAGAATTGALLLSLVGLRTPRRWVR
ncbi:MAG: putative Mg2+ transporter-C (MgtC) family protein, partial [Actinomycetota bacterium]|nr:putative Mg2+ transporter-C (MgtC) family protein [Actinomycetota bacterium]